MLTENYPSSRKEIPGKIINYDRVNFEVFMSHSLAHVIQYMFCGLLIIISVSDKKFVPESACMSKVRLLISVRQKTKEHTHFLPLFVLIVLSLSRVQLVVTPGL